MKKLFPLIVSIVFSISAFGQLEFLPVGASWIEYQDCFGNNFNYFYSVTESGDTVIQGTTCRRIYNVNWICDLGTNPPMYIQQDGGKVFRYDLEDQEFQLVIDYSAQVGESWQVKVCEEIFETDTVTITVDEISGYRREVTVYSNASGISLGKLILVEGVGGIQRGNRLLLVHPFFGSECQSGLLCYEDPAVGVVYTSPPGCIESAVEDPHEKLSVVINTYPNPASAESTLEYQLPPTTQGVVHISDQLGRQQSHFNITGGENVLTLPAYPPGLYFVSLYVEGKVVAHGKFVQL